jgi:dihydrodipicolinate synthase/N-acetylneuraminate lyase
MFIFYNMIDLAMSSVEKIRGLLLPIPTVFDNSGKVDEAMMRKLTDFYLDANVSGFFLLGSCGQGPALTLEERKRVAEVVIERVNHKVPVIVHIGTVDPYTTMDLGLHARAHDADGVAIVGPYYYNDRTEYELLEHFKMVSNAVRMPILIYNNPAYSGYPITPAMMAKIKTAVPSLFGVKLAKGDLDEALAYQKALGPNFSIFIIATYLMMGLLWGMKGTISPPLAMVPEVGSALVKLVDEKRLQEALVLQEKIARFRSNTTGLMKKYGTRAVLRTGIRARGFNVNYPRWPTPELAEEDASLLKNEIEKLRTSIQVPVIA